MKTTTVSEFRKRSADVLKWVEAGEVVTISRRGVVVARVVPVPRMEENGSGQKVDWTKSAAFTRDRTGARILTDEEVRSLLG